MVWSHRSWKAGERPDWAVPVRESGGPGAHTHSCSSLFIWEKAFPWTDMMALLLRSLRKRKGEEKEKEEQMRREERERIRPDTVLAYLRSRTRTHFNN